MRLRNFPQKHSVKAPSESGLRRMKDRRMKAHRVIKAAAKTSTTSSGYRPPNQLTEAAPKGTPRRGGPFCRAAGLEVAGQSQAAANQSFTTTAAPDAAAMRKA
jgi:hypothetical protein